MPARALIEWETRATERGETIPTTTHFTKHHGAGNDFLVTVDLDGRQPLEPAVVRALCDRHLGLGADGVIRVLAGRQGAEVGMELRNADGREAEMSGNGIRCLAQAAVAAGLVSPPVFSVATAAGIRTVEYHPGDRPDVADASVDMGKAELGPDQAEEVPGRRARQVDMGNPHLVLLGSDPSGLAVEELGPQLQAGHPGGINVEFVALGPGTDEVTMRVWERGVGETLACGTGACAAAAAAHSWDLVGDVVTVHNPGGSLRVTLGTNGVSLAGPTQKVADVAVDLDALRASVLSTQ
ncbi:MAG: diaminopimelate epimerase [Acidimicrobiaceae bacterium]|nr:diaminopimelate epimerase [Acidimicrobiaceae bacterium]